MVMIGLAMLLSSGPAGTFSLMPMTDKLLIAGFFSAVGLVLLLYGNPNSRGKAVLFGLLLAAGVLSVPVFVNSDPLANTSGTTPGAPPSPGGPLFPEDEIDPLQALRKRFGTQPLEKEQTSDLTDDARNAFGIYVTGMLERNKYTVRDYLVRSTGADLSSHPYPRDEGNYLVVLTGVGKPIEQVARIAGKTRSHPRNPSRYRNHRGRRRQRPVRRQFRRKPQ